MAIRVLWLIKGLGPGGAEQLLVSLARAHDRSLVDPEVAYVVAAKDALVPALREAGVRVHHLDGRRGSWLWSLRALLRGGRYDVVHAHSPVLAAAARALVHVPVVGPSPRPVIVTTEHNAWSTYALPTRVANAATALLDDATVAVSDESRDGIGWQRVRARTTVVVHGVDLESVRAAVADRDAVRAELGLAPDDVLITTVANYRAQKAYPDLLAAARFVIEADGRAQFAAVGQGPLEAEIRARHRALGLGDRFRLLGYRPDATRVLAASDVFTLASAYEGYPVALMEALALGLPVVATAVGGVAQAVRPGVEGVLVAPGRPDDLARALLEVVRDPSGRARYGAAAQVRGQVYDITRAARQLETLYGEALEKRRSR